MKRLAVLLILMATGATPAVAHKLKVFATVAGNTVSGYAFFIGGGRAENTSWTATTPTGAEIASGNTDDDGRFAFDIGSRPASDLTVTVDTHEGHIASATLASGRFSAIAAAPAPTSIEAADPDARLASLVDAAVERQVAPLMEQIEAMDSRLRVADIVSGVFLILGLAGMALWARGRRR